MPENPDEIEVFATKLAKFGVSLHDYRKSFQDVNNEDTRFVKGCIVMNKYFCTVSL